MEDSIMDEGKDYEAAQAAPDSGFVIDSDVKAEWAVRKIRERRRECERIVALCNMQKAFYTDQAMKEQQQAERDNAYLMDLLAAYFETVPHRRTKTTESYRLAIGVLKRVQPSPEIRRDNSREDLLAWVKNNAPQFLKVTEDVDWAGLKKECEITEDGAIYRETGELVAGVEVVPRAARFDVEVKELG